ncbi:formyltransferase family protein [Chitinophagaceae bacterium MMS25-I14]
MIPKKLVFLGAKPVGYQCFEYLLQNAGSLNIEVVGLLTQNRKEFGEYDLRTLAATHNVPVIASLEEMPECDILYSVQYHQILKAEDIAKAKDIAVNLHMAPLPEYRGCNQFSFAILDQKEEFGTTIHVMDPRIDHGDILFQKRFPIPDECWVHQLYQITEAASVKLFKQTLAALVEGRYNRLPQAALEARYGSSLHFRKEMEEIKQLDKSWPQEKTDRHIRATLMPGFEPPYYLEDGKKMYITEQHS